MGDYVELENKQGVFFDKETGFVLSRDDSKELTEPIGKKTKAALALGKLVRSKPKQEVCHETEGQDGATPSDPATIEPDLGDSQGQAVAETDEGAADGEAHMETAPVETAAPAPRKKRAGKKK